MSRVQATERARAAARASLRARTSWRSFGSKTASRPGAAGDDLAAVDLDLDLAVDHDDVGALVHLMVLELLAGGELTA